MKKAKRWLLISVALLVLVTHAAAVAPFKKVSIATSTATSSTSTTEAAPPATAAGEEVIKTENATSTGHAKNSKLTGIPQIDYIWDPNLPRELRGLNLSTYPFFSTVPPDEDIHFKCDGLHDGFYASIEHKCQIYHHCVYGIRHDFLCANYTAFDQKTFICHFASDVDCEGSKKYWSRNDALYMATTTSTTTTTTTEPPPTHRRRPAGRPLRPLRRPVNRRPSDDYYYDDDQYEDDYYEERLNRRRKQRPRHRKPVVEYDDEYEEKRSFSDDDKPRRPSSRDRFRDDEEEVAEEEYPTDRRKYDQPKLRSKSSSPADRRKTVGGRKPGTIHERPSADERRSFSDDRPLSGRREKVKPILDEPLEPVVVETHPRRLAGRRRINEKRPSPTPAPASDLDDLDDYEKTQSHEQEEAAVADEEEYYEDEEGYHEGQATRGSARRRVVDEVEEEDLPPVSRRRNHNEAPLSRKPTRTTLRKPTTEKKPLPLEDEEYDSTGSASNERIDSRSSGKKRPAYAGRTRGTAATSGRGTDDVDFVDDDYDERPVRPAHRLRPRVSPLKSAKRPRLPVDEIEEDEQNLYEPEAPEQPAPRSRVAAGIGSGRRKPVASARLRQATSSAAPAHEDDIELPESADDVESPDTPSRTSTAPSSRPASVRVVKRPFLPSRGGSPYLPRGLQPVGVGLRSLSSGGGGGSSGNGDGSVAHTTDSSPIDMGSTVSGVRLLEHGAPILRDSGIESVSSQSPRTTLPPRSAVPASQSRPEPPPPPPLPPKVTLDELYENDYDVTLNDALNPTLKPLSPSHSHHHHHQHHISDRDFAPSAFAAASPNAFVNNHNHQQHSQTSPIAPHPNQNNNKNYQQQHQASYQSVPHSPSLPLPLPQSLSQSQTHHQQLQQQQQQQQQLQQQQELQEQQPQSSQQQSPNYNSDSYFSSTDIRRRAIIPSAPAVARSSRTDYYSRGASSVGARIAQHFYDDFEY